MKKKDTVSIAISNADFKYLKKIACESNDNVSSFAEKIILNFLKQEDELHEQLKA